MTKLTFAAAILTAIGALLTAGGVVPLLVTQSLVALTLCLALLHPIRESDEHSL